MRFLDRSTEECQPCETFKSGDEGYFGPVPHDCPPCGASGARYFCANCSTDHHVGGWNTCSHDPSLERMPLCPRAHPACISKITVSIQRMILSHIEEVAELKQKLHDRGEQWKHQMRLMDQDHREAVGKLESEKTVLLFLVKEFGEAVSTIGSDSMITGESCWLGRDTTALIECWDRKNPHATCERLRRAYETWRKIILKNWGKHGNPSRS